MFKKNMQCTSGSVVEYRLAKARVAGSNPVSCSFYIKRRYPLDTSFFVCSSPAGLEWFESPPNYNRPYLDSLFKSVCRVTPSSRASLEWFLQAATRSDKRSASYWSINVLSVPELEISVIILFGQLQLAVEVIPMIWSGSSFGVISRPSANIHAYSMAFR